MNDYSSFGDTWKNPDNTTSDSNVRLNPMKRLVEIESIHSDSEDSGSDMGWPSVALVRVMGTIFFGSVRLRTIRS